MTEVKPKSNVVTVRHQIPDQLFRTPSCVVLRGLQFKNSIETYSNDRIFFGKSTEDGKTVFKLLSYSKGELTEKTYTQPDDLIDEVIERTNAIRKEHNLAPLSETEIIRPIDLS